MKKTMKKGLAYALTLAMLIGNSMFVAKAADANFAGEGTATSPFEISTSADLVKLEQLSLASDTAATYADKHFILTNDLDMSGIAFTGLFRAKEFVGTFDGKGHVIENLTVNRSDNAAAYAGLFACAKGGATIKNLGVVNATMTSGSSKCAGGLIGVIYTGIATPITIENCFVRGINFSSGNNTSGGLVGHIYEGNTANIKNCYTTDLKGSSASGGVSGNVSGGTHTTPILTNVYSTNNIGSTGTNVLGKIGDAATNTIEGFITASNGAFVEGTSDKNGGYPLLAWENASSEQPSGPFSGGEGTEQNPFKISTADDLVELEQLSLDSSTAATYADKHFILTNDLDMSGIAFTGLFRAKEFVGTFDGNGHVIENLTVNRSDNAAAYAGLFACAEGGVTIKNLGVVNATMTSGSSKCAGGIIGVIYGRISNPITIENCFVRGISFSSGNNTSGGLVGHIYEGKIANITNCYTTDLKGSSASGGVSGNVSGGTHTTPILTNVYSTNNIGSGTNVLGNIDEAAANTIEGFITASNGAFVADTDNKNSGYPMLAWEVGIVSLSFENGMVVVNNDTKELLEGVIIIAAYDNTECMLDVCVMNTDLSVAAKSELEVPYDTVSGATKYKAFIWNSMSDMTPICVPAVN